MKRFLLTTIAVTTLVIATNAMSYNTAREQAFFLTDKMAYELNLTNDQYNAAYEINLDYILNIDVAGDLFGIYWERRNNELSYVLTSSQYHTFLATQYFYRPITWVNNKFHYVIYDRYPKKHYYRAAPPAYETYRGGNRYYDNSPYKGRAFDNKVKHDIHKHDVKAHDHHSVPMSKKQAVKQGKERIKNSQRHH